MLLTGRKLGRALSLRGGSPPTMCTQRKPINHTRRTVPTGNARTRLEPRERLAAAPRTGQRAAGRCKPRPRHAGSGSRPWPGGATSLEQHRLYPTPEDTKGLFQNPGRRDGDAGRPPTASSLVSGPCPGHGCRRGGETRQRLPDPSAHRTVLSLVRFVPPGPGFERASFGGSPRALWEQGAWPGEGVCLVNTKLYTKLTAGGTRHVA